MSQYTVHQALGLIFAEGGCSLTRKSIPYPKPLLLRPIQKLVGSPIYLLCEDKMNRSLESDDGTALLTVLKPSSARNRHSQRKPKPTEKPSCACERHTRDLEPNETHRPLTHPQFRSAGRRKAGSNMDQHRRYFDH